MIGYRDVPIAKKKDLKMTNLVGNTKTISNSTGDVQHQVSANLVNTISNIAAYGRASVTRWDQTGDVLSFDIDTHDHREVAAVAKTLAHWLAGKNQDIYVERFVSSDCTTIAIENPILKQPVPFGEVKDRQDRVRDGSCTVQEMNTHEADGFTIAEVWANMGTGAFRDFTKDTIVSATQAQKEV
jgi:hypothetical protein